MKHRFGYSLIELLVSMSIVGMFLAIILPSFRASAPEKKIEIASANIQSYIRSTYSRHWSTTNHKTGLIFDNSSGNNSIKIWIIDPTVPANIVNTYYLPSDITMTFTPTDATIPNILKITFDGNIKTFYNPADPSALHGTDLINLNNPDSTTRSSIEIDRVTGVAAVRITKVP